MRQRPRWRGRFAAIRLARWVGANRGRRGWGHGYWAHVHWQVRWLTTRRQARLAQRSAEEAATWKRLFRQEVVG